MRLIGDFFHIVNTENTEAGLVYLVRLNPDHFIFRAHFPGNPMTPGVCLMQMVTELMEDHFQKNFRLHTAVNIRFKKSIGNDQLLTFRFTKLVLEDDQVNVGVSIEDESTPCVKMSLKMKMEDGRWKIEYGRWNFWSSEHHESLLSNGRVVTKVNEVKIEN